MSKQTKRTQSTNDTGATSPAQGELSQVKPEQDQNPRPVCQVRVQAGHGASHYQVFRAEKGSVAQIATFEAGYRFAMYDQSGQRTSTGQENNCPTPRELSEMDTLMAQLYALFAK